ncbi:MAG TPA: copper chaperone PCu(A)C [Alphaproteobacteria bacterium]|jgi:copper(I)-binding protein
MRLAQFITAILGSACVFAAPALAHEYKQGAIVIEHPWTRATPVKVGGAYMKLRNTGTAPDRLVKVTAPAAEKVEVHETKVEGGMAMMRPVGPVALAPGATVEFKPGGLHVMLMGLAKPLKEGDRLKLVLTFEKAGTIEVEAVVEKAGVSAPGEHKH